jgi:hypothetical protein
MMMIPLPFFEWKNPINMQKEYQKSNTESMTRLGVIIGEAAECVVGQGEDAKMRPAGLHLELPHLTE